MKFTEAFNEAVERKGLLRRNMDKGVYTDYRDPTIEMTSVHPQDLTFDTWEVIDRNSLEAIEYFNKQQSNKDHYLQGQINVLRQQINEIQKVTNAASKTFLGGFIYGK